tara:strand:- start:2861 stop:3253 length:393 start_codon:yes stop_codon:yes gene_type:complete
LANTRKQQTLKALNNWQKRAFNYGDADCCQFAGHVIKEITGIDYMKSFSYSSEEEANKIITTQGGFVSAVTESLGEPCPTEILQDGDPVMVNILPIGQVMGVLFGKHVVCLAEKRMIRVHGRNITHGWAI